MKRVSIEVRHREVTLTMEGSVLHGVRSQPDHESAVAVCPTCGKSRMLSAACTERDVTAEIELVQRVLEQSSVDREDAVAIKPSDNTGATSPDSNAP